MYGHLSLEKGCEVNERAPALLLQIARCSAKNFALEDTLSILDDALSAGCIGAQSFVKVRSVSLAHPIFFLSATLSPSKTVEQDSFFPYSLSQHLAMLVLFFRFLSFGLCVGVQRLSVKYLVNNLSSEQRTEKHGWPLKDDETSSHTCAITTRVVGRKESGDDDEMEIKGFTYGRERTVSVYIDSHLDSSCHCP